MQMKNEKAPDGTGTRFHAFYYVPFQLITFENARPHQRCLKSIPFYCCAFEIVHCEDQNPTGSAFIVPHCVCTFLPLRDRNK